jgi:hypothetical protein
LPNFTPEAYSHWYFWMTAHFGFDYRASKLFSLNRRVQVDFELKYTFFSPGSNIRLKSHCCGKSEIRGVPEGSYFYLVCKVRPEVAVEFDFCRLAADLGSLGPVKFHRPRYGSSFEILYVKSGEPGAPFCGVEGSWPL